MSHVRAFTAFDEWLRPWINLSVTKSLCLLVTSGRYCLSCHRPTPQPLSDWRLRIQSYGRGSNIWSWPLPWESLLRKETSRHSCSGLAMQVYPYQLIYMPARSSSPMRYSAPSKISSVSSWPLVRHQGTVCCLLCATRTLTIWTDKPPPESRELLPELTSAVTPMPMPMTRLAEQTLMRSSDTVSLLNISTDWIHRRCRRIVSHLRLDNLSCFSGTLT